MSFVYGFGFNGFGQITTERQELVHEPVYCIQPNVTNTSNTKVPHLSTAWESILYLQDGKIILKGFCNKQSHATCFLNLEDLHITSPTEVAMLVHRENLIGVLLNSKQFFLYEVIHQDKDEDLLTANSLVNYSHNISLLFACKDDLIKIVACGFNKTKWTLVTENSQVKTVQESSELGQYNLLPEITMKIAIMELSCGYDHCLALTSGGRVFSWGIGSRGQLGHGNLASFGQPQVVEALDGVKIRQVCCGGWHSTALAETNDLYTWGWNESGQTGFPAPKNMLSTSTNIKTKKEQTTESDSNEECVFRSGLSASENAAATSTGVCISEKSVVINTLGVKEQDSDIVEETCQNDDSLQYEPVGMVTSPLLLELEGYLKTKHNGFVSVLQVACGSRHTAAILSPGQLVTWGWGKYGQLGHICCLKNSNVGSKEAQLCSNTAHPPALVSWFERKPGACRRLWCGIWNTFVEVSSIA